MNTYMHKTMASVASLEKIEIIRSQEFMLSKARLKFLKKMIILGAKTAILGPQFCRILVLGPHFWWSGGAGPPAPPGSAPVMSPHEAFNRLHDSTHMVKYQEATKYVIKDAIGIFCQGKTCCQHLLPWCGSIF